MADKSTVITQGVSQGDEGVILIMFIGDLHLRVIITLVR